MFGPQARLRRERRTLEAMTVIYCRDIHGGAAGLCAPCRELVDYANQRLDRCPFGPEKPTCVKCPIHCYGAAHRERVRTVMRYSGPRMLWRHPLLALLHLLDSRRKPGPVPKPRSGPPPPAPG